LWDLLFAVFLSAPGITFCSRHPQIRVSRALSIVAYLYYGKLIADGTPQAPWLPRCNLAGTYRFDHTARGNPCAALAPPSQAFAAPPFSGNTCTRSSTNILTSNPLRLLADKARGGEIAACSFARRRLRELTLNSVRHRCTRGFNPFRVSAPSFYKNACTCPRLWHPLFRPDHSLLRCFCWVFGIDTISAQINTSFTTPTRAAKSANCSTLMRNSDTLSPPCVRGTITTSPTPSFPVMPRSAQQNSVGIGQLLHQMSAQVLVC